MHVACCVFGLQKPAEFDPNYKGPVDWSQRRCHDVHWVLGYVRVVHAAMFINVLGHLLGVH